MKGDTERVVRLRALAQWLAALADVTRVAMVLELAGGERPVGELAEATGTTVVNASHHLTMLKRSGLVAATPSGRHRWYRLVGATVTPGAVELGHASGTRVAFARTAPEAGPKSRRGKR